MLMPSPWYRLPIIILHDPENVVSSLVDRSKVLDFTVAADDIDFSISKGLAAAHETYRRAKRGEIFYSQTLLDELRQQIMQSDDWLNDRTPETTVVAKFERRSSKDVRQVLANSYCKYDADMILGALNQLVVVYRDQVVRLHQRFKLSRPLKNDLAALAACWT